MKIISEKRCIIGECPIWNDFEKKLYYTNGMGGNELCMYDLLTNEITVRPLKTGAAAYAFCKDGRLIVSRPDGVFILNGDDSVTELYDRRKYSITFANDMKVGPDGRIYVGTQSQKRKGVSDKIDGKLYSIDKHGDVRVLLDGLILSNGLEWSMDEKYFYHTDSDTRIIKEYVFDKTSGDISFAGRSVEVPSVDGFTVGRNDKLYVGCWAKSHIAVVDTRTMTVEKHIPLPVRIPTSCGFCGENMDILAVTTASYNTDINNDKNAGFTFLLNTDTSGRRPYLFG